MGRPRKVLSQDEIEARKQRWFGQERNARRRQKYAEDKGFRERERSRVLVANRNPEAVPDRPDPKEVLANVRARAVRRDVIFPDGTTRKRMVLTTEELAEAIGRKVHILYRWRQVGKWPHGILHIRSRTGNPKQVYSLEEARAMVGVLTTQLGGALYYHSSRQEVRNMLFAAVAEVRHKEGLTDERARQNPLPAAAAE